ncbi:hypothetical protein EO087_13755 [Dyella sp. M7H15-1]|uniref:hypothetical protein n=1 Tax=Dyella sp. M7H15-1 TaxID=2501295 RepID=UPI001004EBA3|nr:hypothetical protein [Dyella sp. M7H15-1]QAU24922.1 hypothetical protein EO087_13755 [Dyella sp. M7H15-1]
MPELNWLGDYKARKAAAKVRYRLLQAEVQVGDPASMLYEPELLAEFADFSLANLPVDLPSFQRESSVRPYLIDVERGRMRVEEDSAQYNLDIDSGDDGIRREDLLRALDRRLRRDDILQADMIAWLGRVLDGLQARGFELAYLMRHARTLADVMAERLAYLLRQERHAAFQQSLLDGHSRIRIDSRMAFQFDSANYPARWWYDGTYRFKKHYYPLPGELKGDNDAEETQCAIVLDSSATVERWVRNLERQPMASFWLPTSTDRFYPDFIARLKDGRLCAVEYKGGYLESNNDSREKRDIGSVWAAASEGRCVFAMVTDAKTAGSSMEAQLTRVIGE